MSLRAAISAFAHRGARRRDQLAFVGYSFVLTVALSGLAAWIAQEERPSFAATASEALDPRRWSTLALSDVFALGVLMAVGFVLAPALVAATVGQERRAGTLDQLRTTPLSPVGLALGFVIGAPARLYLLCVGPLSLHLLASLTGVVPLATLPGVLVLLVVGTLASCLLALALALATRQEAGALQAVLLAAGLGLATLLASAMAPEGTMAASYFGMHPAGALSGLLASAPTLWQRIFVSDPYGPSAMVTDILALAPFVSTLLSLGAAVLLLRASGRKLRAPHLPLLSKPQALFAFTLVAAMALVPAYGRAFASDRDYLLPLERSAVAALLPLVMVVLGALCTPSPEAWARALRGGARIRWRADDASPWVTMWLMVAVWVVLILPIVEGSRALRGDELRGLGWGALVLLSLPLYVQLGMTRFSSTAARTAFAVAVAVHLMVQLVGVRIVCELDSIWPVEGSVTFLGIAGVAAVVVPLWGLCAQRALDRRIRALLPSGQPLRA